MIVTDDQVKLEEVGVSAKVVDGVRRDVQYGEED